MGCDPGNVTGLGERIAQLLPVVEAPLQRTHTRDSQLLQFLCHTGTGGFIGSSAVEDDLFVFGESVRAAGDLFRQNTDCAGKRTGIGDGIQWMAEIEDHQALT